MLQPTVRRTWAPKGKTPVHHSWDRRDRLSAISAITVSPKRNRLGLYFDILNHNVKTDDFEHFIASLLRRLGLAARFDYFDGGIGVGGHDCQKSALGSKMRVGSIHLTF